MASKRQLGGNLGHLKAILRRKRAHVEFGSEGVGGMREALLAPQEGNSEEIKPCPSGRSPTQRVGLKAAAGFKPAERGPGGGLTAAYCTRFCNYEFAFKNKVSPTREMFILVAKLGPS